MTRPPPPAPEAHQAFERALEEARPHELAAAAAAAIRRLTGAPRAQVLLADYRQAYLVPVGSGEEMPLDNTPPGRAYAGQRSVAEGAGTLHLPLSVRGERLGVWSVTLPEEVPEPDWLAGAAAALARALKIADAATDAYRRVRRRARLTLAAEMQWDLLPPSACRTERFAFAGQLEPAYAVWGDNFDWAVSPERLTLTVSNGMGSGTRAAALTHLAVSALRNARRSDGDIAEQAALADQALYGRYRGEEHVATLLLDVELATGRTRVIDAGSPKIYRLRGNVTEGVPFDAQLPLGMFGDTVYQVEEFAIEPRDRLIIVSDGVHEALAPDGASYGATVLLQALRDTRLQDPPEAVRTLVRHLVAYQEGGEPTDDAVIVCLDWLGPDGDDDGRPG